MPRQRFSRCRTIAMTMVLVCLPVLAQAEGGISKDFCNEIPHGDIPELPEPFSNWAFIVCTTEGQVLAAQLDGEPVFWVRHGTAEPVYVSALPPGLPSRDAMIEDMGSMIGFLAAGGTQLGSDHPVDTGQLFQAAFPDADPRGYDAVWLLQLQSFHILSVYSLIFFTQDNVPQHVVLCLNDCRSSLSLDVLSPWEAGQRASRNLLEEAP